MNNNQLLATIHTQDQEIQRLRHELQQRHQVNYEDKYKKALKSIEEIIRANKQIKDQLDNLRIMRQADLENFTNIQKQQFKKAYDALLKDKNTLVISLQSMELDNQKLKYNVSELQNQVTLYRNQKQFRFTEERETLLTNQHSDVQGTVQNSRRSDNRDNKDYQVIIRQKQAEFHRTIENYEQHHNNMAKTTKRLQQRIFQLENKLNISDKNWRIKLQTKQLQVIDIKALTRQEFTEQITALRKQNSNLKIINNDLAIKLETNEKNIQISNNMQTYDWQAQIVQEMINIKANLEPLRQQISELTEINLYDKEESIRERTSLQTRVLELDAQVERQRQTIKNYERTIFQNHQSNRALQQKMNSVKKLQEENQLLHGKVIVMQSRQIALRNRSGEDLQERVLQFQSRIQLLLNNKQSLKELRQIGIHQLLALKAYIMQLDSKLKELITSNGYLLKKYKSYKQKYQSSLKEHKQYGMTINSLKMKILGYDKLVLKLQGELERLIKMNQSQMTQINKHVSYENNDVYRHKYELMKEKLQIQAKYKQQEIETLKLHYQTKIMELTIKIEDIRAYKDTIELYKSKNQELQFLVSRKESQLFQSKILTSSKVVNSQSDQYNPRQTKQIINNLHSSLKQSDQTIFKLQSQLRVKQDTYKRTTLKLQRQISDLKQDHQKVLNRKEMDYSMTLDQQIKKYKMKITDLEHNTHFSTISFNEQHSKKNEEADSKYRKLEARLNQAESKIEEEAFTKRRLEKQILELTHDKDQSTRSNNQLQLKISQYRQLQRQNEQLKSKLLISSKNESKTTIIDYQLQSKESIIKKLNNQIFDLKSSLGVIGEKDIMISSFKNQNNYLKKEIEQLNQIVNKYNNQIIFLKNTLDSNKVTYHSGFQNLLEEKEAVSTKIRKELYAKEAKIMELQEQIQILQGKLRKLSRQTEQMNNLRDEYQSISSQLRQKDRAIERIRSQNNLSLQDIQRLRQELTYVKQSYQKQSYDILQRDDQISKLQLQLNMINLRNKQQYESRFTQQLIQKQRAYNKLSSEYSTFKSKYTYFDQQKKYLQDNIAKLTTQVYNYKTQISELNDQNQKMTDQHYYKQQQFSKISYSLQSYQNQVEEYQKKEEESYRFKNNQLNQLKSIINGLEEEAFNKEAVYARLTNDNNYLRAEVDERAEDIAKLQESVNRLTYDLNQTRSEYTETQMTHQEQSYYLQKANTQLTSLRNKYRNLEQQMQEREHAFSLLTQDLSKFKSSLSFYQQQIEEKQKSILRLTGDREHVQQEIISLQEELSSKAHEINRLKQQIFSLKMQESQRDYEQKMRIQQDIYRLKTRISSLQNEVQDKDSDIRKLNIQIQSVRHTPAPAPLISEEEAFELHNELSKKQRDLVNMKFDLEDKNYQIESLTSNINMIKKSLNEYQERLQTQRQEFQTNERKLNSRERQLQDQIYRLNYEIQSKINYVQPKPIQPLYNQNEQELQQLQSELTKLRRQLNGLKYELQDKLFTIQGLQSNISSQESIIRQLQNQSSEGHQHYQVQIQDLLRKQRSRTQEVKQKQENIQSLEQQIKKNQSKYQLSIQQYQQQIEQYTQEISVLKVRFQSNKTTLNGQSDADSKANLYVSSMSQKYLQEIDRLTAYTQDLQNELSEFKIKVSSMINQESRIQQNLVTMTLLFAEVESLRERIKNKQTQIETVRKSFIQMAVSGEIQPNQMSRIMALNPQQEETYSIDRIQSQPSNPQSKVVVAPFQRIVQIQQQQQLQQQHQLHHQQHQQQLHHQQQQHQLLHQQQQHQLLHQQQQHQIQHQIQHQVHHQQQQHQVHHQQQQHQVHHQHQHHQQHQQYQQQQIHQVQEISHDQPEYVDNSSSSNQEEYTSSEQQQGGRQLVRGSLIEDLQRQSLDGSTHRGQITIRIPNMNPAQFAGQPNAQSQQRNASHTQQVVHHSYPINQQVAYHRPNQSMQSHVVFPGTPTHHHQQQQQQQQPVVMSNNNVYAQPYQNLIAQPQVRLVAYNQQAHPYPPARQ